MVAPRRTFSAASSSTTGRAEHCSTSGSRDEDDDESSCETHDFIAMLIQDWLQASNFRLTLRCFVDEHKHLGKELPRPEKWYSMTERLQMDQFNRLAVPRNAPRDCEVKGSLPSPSLLELVVRFTITERQRELQRHWQQQQPQQPTVLVSKRLMQVKELKILTKRGLSSTASALTLRESPTASCGSMTSNGTLSGGLRPKSAAVCTSTPELISRSLLGRREPFSVNQVSPSKNEERPSNAARTGGRATTRPISASGALVTPSRDSVSTRSPSIQESNPHSNTSPQLQTPQRSPPSQQRRSLKAENTSDSAADQRDRRVSRASITGLPLIVEDKLGKQAVAQMNDLDNDPDEEETAADPETPALDLEEMSEERLVAQFSSLDRTAIKKLRRVLAKSNACTQEFERAKRTIDKIHTKAKQRQVRRVLTGEQTQLLSNSTDILNKEPCSLCQRVFLKKNLAMRVSYKSILDLRRSWSKNKEKEDREQAHHTVHNENNDHGKACEPESMICGESSGRIEDSSTFDRAQQAHLYDEVPVCAFCSQLVLHCSSYRPSSAAQKAQLAEDKRQATEQQKQKETARIADLNRCDPLDFDSYRLNSDDDDSDCEEVLEIDADGRVHITKRRRQKTGRVPAQLGLVSKRIHYDQLRSRTLPSLNNKEWQVIS